MFVEVEGKKIEIKGDCFDKHGMMITDPFTPKNFNAKGQLFLIHAEVSGQKDLKDLRFGHAWLEDDEMVYDYTNGRTLEIPKELYYAIAGVIKAPGKYIKYSRNEIREMSMKHAHWGPWELECKI